MNSKHLLILDLVIVLGSLGIIAGIMGYSRPLVISPLDNEITSNGAVIFSFEDANKILIDTNLEFTSPQEIYVTDNIIINLKPGEYYWKAVGLSSSEIRKLTVESSIDLSLRPNGQDGFEVVNSGNTPLDVEIYANGAFSGKLFVDVDESVYADGDKFIGRENEN